MSDAFSRRHGASGDSLQVDIIYASRKRKVSKLVAIHKLKLVRWCRDPARQIDLREILKRERRWIGRIIRGSLCLVTRRGISRRGFRQTACLSNKPVQRGEI